MKKRITVKDIADQSGVSVGTVDRVIHNRGNVASDVAEKVKKVMADLGYERNLLASALAYNKSYQIAVVMPLGNNDAYWQKPRQGVMEAMKQVGHFGMNIQFFDFNIFNLSSFKDALNKAMLVRPHALIFPPMFYTESIAFLDTIDDTNLKVITFNTFLLHEKITAFIGQNSYNSGLLAARMLTFNETGNHKYLLLNLDKYTNDANHLIDKENGFNAFVQKMNAAHPAIIKFDFDQFDDDQSLQAFIQGIFCNHKCIRGCFITNSRAFLVANTIKQISPHTLIIGFDLIDENILMMQRGQIDFLINQNSQMQGYKCIMTLYDHFYLEKEIAKTDFLPLDIIVPENAEYYL